MDKIERTFQTRLQKRPEDMVRLIVHVRGDMSQATARLTQLGVPVLRSFSLIKAVAVSCSGEKALALLQEPWVQSIEEDRQVFIQRQDVEDST
ncbi:hypothetical protein FDZ71_17910 [bacterium]|nr:MAG: hypothetical protein FDZ71_17910 [bacterium]